MIKKLKIKKLSTTLICYSVIILLVLNTIAAVLMSFESASAMNSKQNDYLEKSLTSAEERIEQFVENYINIGQMLSDNQFIRSAVAESTTITPMLTAPSFPQAVYAMTQTVNRYDGIMSIGIGSIAENNIYTDSGQQVNIVLKDREYYAAVTNNQPYVTEPYADTITGNICVSIGLPIVYDGRTVGVLCLDINLNGLYTFIESMSFGESGRMLLISENRVIMAYTNKDMLGSDFSVLGIAGDEFMSELDNPTGNLTNYTINNQQKVAMITEIEDYNWTLVVGMSSSEYNSATFRVIGFLVLLLIAITIVLCLLLRNIITKKLTPVTKIKHALSQMRDGNLHIHLESTSNDEIGQISQSIIDCTNTLSSYITEIDTIMKQLADGNLRVRYNVKFKGDFEPIQKSIGRFVAQLSELVHNVAQSAASVNSSSMHVSSGAQELAQGSTEQAASIEELMETISEISTKIETTADDTQLAQKQVVAANNSLNQSNVHMTNLANIMSRISNDSTKIHSIIKTIEDIAFQTNILALNAAVEAARAGQSGKGFAVVADEVRNLSSKSTAAASQIAQLIERSVKSIEEGEQATQKTTLALAQTVEQASVVGEIIDKISNATIEQSNAIHTVNKSMDQISSVVKNNSANAEESAAASEELSSQSHILEEMINHFKL